MLNRNDDQNDAKNMILFCIAAASIVVLLFLVVLLMHENKKSSLHVAKEELAEDASDDVVVGKSNFVSKDLDFWEMYDEQIVDDEEDSNSEKFLSKSVSSFENSLSKSDRFKDENGISGLKSSSSEKRRRKDDENEDDKASDDKSIRVIGKDGRPAWYDISDDIAKNNYNFDDYLTYDDGFLKYIENGKKSLTGIKISSRDGTIDFDKVKSSGVDYVMIKVGSRGYDSGLVSIDEKFVEYTQGATAAGLDIGMYFISNAITDLEAIEEANYAVAACANYKVNFPIAIDISNISDESRSEKLTSTERTAIINKFCETVKTYGKTPAICATRDWLISELDVEKLNEYEIWLKDESSGDEYFDTDYPYQFSMWNYSDSGNVSGVNGSVNLNISFVNYAER